MLAHCCGIRPCATILFLVALTLGCQNRPSPIPDTFPVKGKIIDANGRPVPGGTVHFSPAANTDAMLLINGEIENGEFTISTRRVVGDFEERDGAPEGEYRVTMKPPAGQEHGKRTSPWSTTIKVRPTENDFMFKVSE